LLYDKGQCPPSIRTELADNFLAEKSPIKILDQVKVKSKLSSVPVVWQQFLQNVGTDNTDVNKKPQKAIPPFLRLSSCHVVPAKLII